MDVQCFQLGRPLPYVDASGTLCNAYDFVWPVVQVPRIAGQLFRPSFVTRARLDPAPAAPFPVSFDNDDAEHTFPLISYVPLPIAGAPLLDLLQAAGVSLQRFPLEGETSMPRPWRLEVFNFIGPTIDTVVKRVPGGEVPGWSAQWGEVVVVPQQPDAPAYWCFDKLAIAPGLRAEVERAFGEQLSFTPVLQQA